MYRDAYFMRNVFRIYIYVLVVAGKKQNSIADVRRMASFPDTRGEARKQTSKQDATLLYVLFLSYATDERISLPR